MSLVVGLGNPGDRYSDSRHNLGFHVVEALAERRGIRLDRLHCNSMTGTAESLILAAPQTYMNRSGYAVRCLAEHHELDPERILVVYDEVHLPVGRMRLRRTGGPGGHRGMESVIHNLRTEEVARLRLGVGPEGGPAPGEDLVDYVLAPFEEAERGEIGEVIKRATDACEWWLREGPEAAMSRFNN